MNNVEYAIQYDSTRKGVNALAKLEGLGKRELNKLKARSDILCSAVEIFQSKGYVEASIADIMTLAGRGVGTFYNYFASKEDLIMALLMSIGERIGEVVAQGREQNTSSIELLRTASDVAAEFIDSNRYVLPLFISASHNVAVGEGEINTPREERQRPATPNIKQVFAIIIAEGQQKGEIREDIPVDVIAEVFHSLFQAAAFSQIDMPFRENIRLKTMVLLEGIRSRATF